MKLLKTIAILLIYTSLWAGSNEMKIFDQQGNVLIRHGFENEWKPVINGQTISDNSWIKSMGNSSAKIEVCSNRVFRLPANTLVEVGELKSYGCSEFLLILTSIEISNLQPNSGKPGKPSGAYVIHGEPSDKSIAVNNPAVKQYIEYEMNGLEALFEQSFWAGVILKIFKLMKYEKMIDPEPIQYKLIVACHSLNLMRRYQQAKEIFFKQYPTSKFLSKIKDLQ